MSIPVPLVRDLNQCLACPPPRFNRQFNDLVGKSLFERKSDQSFSIHRFIQDAFWYWCDKDQALQHFRAAVHIVHQFLPCQVNERPMHDSRDLIQHGQILATRFNELQERFPGEIEPPSELLELLKSCAWYLFEMADHAAAIALLDTVLETVPDKARNTEIYAHLLNTIARSSFELNDLARCRRELDKALTIREEWARKKGAGRRGGAGQHTEQLREPGVCRGKGRVGPLVFFQGQDDPSQTKQKCNCATLTEPEGDRDGAL